MQGGVVVFNYLSTLVVCVAILSVGPSNNAVLAGEITTTSATTMTTTTTNTGLNGQLASGHAGPQPVSKDTATITGVVANAEGKCLAHDKLTALLSATKSRLCAKRPLTGAGPGLGCFAHNGHTPIIPCDAVAASLFYAYTGHRAYREKVDVLYLNDDAHRRFAALGDNAFRGKRKFRSRSALETYMQQQARDTADKKLVYFFQMSFYQDEKHQVAGEKNVCGKDHVFVVVKWPEATAAKPATAAMTVADNDKPAVAVVAATEDGKPATASAPSAAAAVDEDAKPVAAATTVTDKSVKPAPASSLSCLLQSYASSESMGYTLRQWMHGFNVAHSEQEFARSKLKGTNIGVFEAARKASSGPRNFTDFLTAWGELLRGDTSRQAFTRLFGCDPGHRVWPELMMLTIEPVDETMTGFTQLLSGGGRCDHNPW